MHWKKETAKKFCWTDQVSYLGKLDIYGDGTPRVVVWYGCRHTEDSLVLLKVNIEWKASLVSSCKDNVQEQNLCLQSTCLSTKRVSIYQHLSGNMPCLSALIISIGIISIRSARLQGAILTRWHPWKYFLKFSNYLCHFQQSLRLQSWLTNMIVQFSFL